MNNPTPRPALRKAPDADVHPAAPSASIDLRDVNPATDDSVKATPEVTVVADTAGHTKPAKSPKSKKPGKGKTNKRREKRTALRVKVPQSVRAELRATAKARGTSVDDVVSTVLSGWLDK